MPLPAPVSAWWSSRTPLQAPTRQEFLGFSVGLGLFALLLLNVAFVPLLDHANLAFHEAGHLLFRVLGETASLYGGTLMQYVFPALTTGHFLHRGQSVAAAVCAVWFCENLRYMALYMADARTQELPLVGGGEHDWFHILSRWDLLASDTRLANVATALCWIGMGAIWFALWKQRQRPA
jgi:hypothetical protein